MVEGQIVSIRFPEKWNTLAADASRTDIVALSITWLSLGCITIYDNSKKQFVKTFDLQNLGYPWNYNMVFHLNSVTSAIHAFTAPISEYNIHWISGANLRTISLGTN